MATAAAAQHTTNGLEQSRRGASAACIWRDPDATGRALAARAVTLSVHPVDEVRRLRWFATDCNDLQTRPNQRRRLPARGDSPGGPCERLFPEICGRESTTSVNRADGVIHKSCGQIKGGSDPRGPFVTQRAAHGPERYCPTIGWPAHPEARRCWSR
jgi:hypothetical protein